MQYLWLCLCLKSLWNKTVKCISQSHNKYYIYNAITRRLNMCYGVQLLHQTRHTSDCIKSKYMPWFRSLAVRLLPAQRMIPYKLTVEDQDSFLGTLWVLLESKLPYQSSLVYRLWILTVSTSRFIVYCGHNHILEKQILLEEFS